MDIMAKPRCVICGRDVVYPDGLHTGTGREAHRVCWKERQDALRRMPVVMPDGRRIMFTAGEKGTP